MRGTSMALRLAAVAAVSGTMGLALLGTPSGARAQQGPQGPARAEGARPPVSQDPAAAPAGTYKLDSNHASAIVRIKHEGTSYSTFRFNTVAGVLSWDPAHIEASKLSVTVDPKSLVTPVAGFADNLTGPHYLNTAQFAQATFVSTGIRRTGPTTGVITGDLTLVGQTKPITINAELIGVRTNMRGAPTFGFAGVTKFKRSDFGLTTLIPSVGDEVELSIDVEFNRQN
jgi:polyisoprenoid-binding protein YceI